MIEPDAVRCKNSGKDVTSARRDEVTVRAWNLLNKVVRSKGTEDAIAEAVDAEFSATDGTEQSQIRLGPGPDGTDGFVSVDGGLTDIADEFTERSGCIHGRQRIQIAVIGSLTDLSAPIEVGDAAASGEPVRFSVGIAFLLA